MEILLHAGGAIISSAYLLFWFLIVYTIKFIYTLFIFILFMSQVLKKFDLIWTSCLFIELDSRCFSIGIYKMWYNFFLLILCRKISKKVRVTWFPKQWLSVSRCFVFFTCVLLSYYIRAIKPWKIKT